MGGGKSAAIAYTLIETAKLNRVDPQVWLTDVLGRIADHKSTRLDELLPWRYADKAALRTRGLLSQSTLTGHCRIKQSGARSDNRHSVMGSGSKNIVTA